MQTLRPSQIRVLVEVQIVITALGTVSVEISLMRSPSVEERILTKKVYNSSGTVIETVIYVDENFVRVVNTSGTYDFTYVKHEGQLIGQKNSDGTKLFIHGDHEGSTSTVTNEAGTVVENTTYSPFGEIVTGGTNRFDYEGKEYDSVVGDYDFNFRKYKAEWGLFTQPDTLIQNVYDPQSLNRYMFELANPYKHTDPSGHEGEPADLVEFFNRGIAIYLLSQENKRIEEDKRYEELYEQYRVENPGLPPSPYVNVMVYAGPGKATIEKQRRVGLDTLETWNSGKMTNIQSKVGSSDQSQLSTLKGSTSLQSGKSGLGKTNSGGVLSKLWKWITGTKESTESSSSSNKPPTSNSNSPSSSGSSSRSSKSLPKRLWWCFWCKR